MLPPARQPLCLVTTPAQMVAFQPSGSATTILHTASQISSRISDFPKKLSFWGRGEGVYVFCLVTDWRAQCWSCCSTWWQWRFARGNAGVTPRHTGSLNLWEQQRETLRRGSGGVGGVGGLQRPQLPLPPSLVPPTLTDLGLFIQFAAH